MKTKTPKKFLFVSYEGVMLDVAWTMKLEGHDVRLYIEKKSEKEIGAGFVRRIKNWEEYTDWADVIVFDQIGYGKIVEELRAKGKLVIGGTRYTDKLEDDRSFGQSEMKKHGIKILDYEEFHDFDSAINFVEQHPTKYVIKPSGIIQHQKQLLFVGMEEDGSDVVRILKAYKKTWGDAIGTFQLQKKVSGVEIGVGGFFNGKKFIDQINVNFEHKKLFPGELGVATGEMGTSMFWQKNVRLFEKTLRKFESTLAEEKYVGYIDINLIVNSFGAFPLEFTCRFGHPLISIQRAGITNPIGDFFWDLASGKDSKLKIKKGFQVGVLVVLPPFPYKDNKTFASFAEDAVVVFKKPMLEGIHPQDLRCYKNEWLVTGSSGIAVLITGCGTTMKDAKKQAYSRIHNITLPNMYYRNDISDRWDYDSDKLRSWGYI